MALTPVSPCLFTYRCIVLHVYDGDTMTIDIDLGFNIWMRDQKIRLYGVDTPELRGEEREKGLEVRDLVRSWAPAGTEAILRSHKDEQGKYGRWLAEIFLPGEKDSINQWLWRAGLAEIEAYTEADRRKIEARMRG